MGTSAPRKNKGEGKAKKKTKLPGQPKRPMSAYFLWLNSEGRDKIKEENPGFGVTEVSKKAGEMWAKIDSDTKDRFEKKAKAAKEKYEEDYKEWLEGGGAEALKAAKKEKKASGSSPKKSPKEVRRLKQRHVWERVQVRRVHQGQRQQQQRRRRRRRQGRQQEWIWI